MDPFHPHSSHRAGLTGHSSTSASFSCFGCSEYPCAFHAVSRNCTEASHTGPAGRIARWWRPPPPHGYEEVEDSETALANYSATVRTHEPLGLPGPNAEQKTNGPNNLPSHFSIFGVPVIFNAPVTSPYYNEDTPATYAGHPSNGQTNILVNGDASPIH